MESTTAPTSLDKYVSLLINPDRKNGFWKNYSNLIQKMLFKGSSMQLLQPTNKKIYSLYLLSFHV